MNTKLTCFIVDDEPRAINSLSYLLTTYCREQVEIIGSTSHYEKGIATLKELQPDILFLDIKLNGGKTGFDLLEALEDLGQTEVIFTTAYNDYAVDAFRQGAANYLLKPVNPDELMVAVKRIAVKITAVNKTANKASENKSKDRIFLPDRKGWASLFLRNVVYFKSENNYTHIHMADGIKEVVSKSLSYIEQHFLVNNKEFLRVQKSYIININNVVRINKQDSGFVEMIDGTEVPVSLALKKQVFNTLIGQAITQQ